MTCICLSKSTVIELFQYRKRYEVTCDLLPIHSLVALISFQYRKRYEVTCDLIVSILILPWIKGFNTASGMRSHVTIMKVYVVSQREHVFQYRKRYEVTCDRPTRGAPSDNR